MTERVSANSLPAPDIAGTVDAWRVWRVIACDGAYVLGSVIKPTVWAPRRPLLAECARERTAFARLRRRRRHPAPDPACACGIYAAGLDQLGQYLNEGVTLPAVGLVVGQVALWGTVVECERGFRASHAYPLRIFVPSDVAAHGERAGELLKSLAAYGVPVEVLSEPRPFALQAVARQAA